jgi:hypothetical protein
MTVQEKFKHYTKIYDSPNGGTIWRHDLVLDTIKAEEYKNNYEAALYSANEGKEVKMLPELEEGNELRAAIFPNSKFGKCPDLFVNDEYVEVKCPEPDPSRNTLQAAVKNASKQADIVFIFIYGKMKEPELHSISDFRFGLHKELKKVIFQVIGKKPYTYDRRNYDIRNSNIKKSNL